MVGSTGCSPPRLSAFIRRLAVEAPPPYQQLLQFDGDEDDTGHDQTEQQLSEGEGLGVRSRTITWYFSEQMRLFCVPLFHGIHGASVTERFLG